VQAVGQGFQTPQRQIQRPNFQSPRFAPPPPQRNINEHNSGVVGPCYSCGQSGHYTNRCPRKQANQTPTPGTNQNVNRNANNSASTPARQDLARARVNHVAVEDAQATPDVIIGMILVNDNNAIVLFDSGASHSFVAANFVQKHNLPLSMLKNWMIVSSPRGDMHARHVCPKVNILIRGVVFTDDILIFSKNEEDHDEHLRVVLQKLRENQLYAKLSKCKFWLKEVLFLGLIISKGGIYVDPSKVKDVLSWKTPQNVSDI
jgi:hypothetical protein